MIEPLPEPSRVVTVKKESIRALVAMCTTLWLQTSYTRTLICSSVVSGTVPSKAVPVRSPGSLAGSFRWIGRRQWRSSIAHRRRAHSTIVRSSSHFSSTRSSADRSSAPAQSSAAGSSAPLGPVPLGPLPLGSTAARSTVARSTAARGGRAGAARRTCAVGGSSGVGYLPRRLTRRRCRGRARRLSISKLRPTPFAAPYRSARPHLRVTKRFDESFGSVAASPYPFGINCTYQEDRMTS